MAESFEAIRWRACTDGVDAKLVAGLMDALETEGSVLEIVAPAVGDVQMGDGKHLKAITSLVVSFGFIRCGGHS